MGAMMPQVPNVHCGDLGQHERHLSPSGSTWCDGIPPMEPFVELVVRVPLKSHGFPDGYTHRHVVQDISDEGIGTYTTDELFDGGLGAGSLRVRWGGEDRVYPLKDGKPVLPDVDEFLKRYADLQPETEGGGT